MYKSNLLSYNDDRTFWEKAAEPYFANHECFNLNNEASNHGTPSAEGEQLVHTTFSNFWNNPLLRNTPRQRDTIKYFDFLATENRQSLPGSEPFNYDVWDNSLLDNPGSEFQETHPYPDIWGNTFRIPEHYPDVWGTNPITPPHIPIPWINNSVSPPCSPNGWGHFNNPPYNPDAYNFPPYNPGFWGSGFFDPTHNPELWGNNLVMPHHLPVWGNNFGVPPYYPPIWGNNFALPQPYPQNGVNISPGPVNNNVLNEPIPVVNEQPVVNKKLVLNEPPVVHKTPVVNDTPVVNEASVADEASVVVETSVVDKASTVVDTSVVDENYVVIEIPIADEMQESGEASVTDEPPLVTQRSRFGWVNFEGQTLCIAIPSSDATSVFSVDWRIDPEQVKRPTVSLCTPPPDNFPPLSAPPNSPNESDEVDFKKEDLLKKIAWQLRIYFESCEATESDVDVNSPTNEYDDDSSLLSSKMTQETTPTTSPHPQLDRKMQI